MVAAVEALNSVWSTPIALVFENSIEPTAPVEARPRALIAAKVSRETTPKYLSYVVDNQVKYANINLYAPF